jgi:hypothetical protein
MKKILLTTICIAFATFSFSQQISRHVVASGGNYSSNSGYTISSTIGESMVTTLTSASNVLTQGFQQSFSNSVDPTITIINPLDGSIHYCLDNPTIGFVVSDFTVGLPGSGGDGHIHYSVNGTSGPMQYDTTHIQLNNLTNGSYQFIVELVDNSHSSFSPVISDTVNFTINIILGCTDSTASNYDPTATCDNSSCTYCVYGCIDSIASNYDPSATCDDGSCTYPCADNVVVFNGYDSYGDGWNGATYDISSGGVVVASGGSTFTTGASFTDTLCLPTGCYDVTVGGGTWDSEISFDFASLVGADTGTYTDVSVGGAICVLIYGCTDTLACNYNNLANLDDGSCLTLYGCTNPSALNYDSLANCLDTCIFPQVTLGCTDSIAINYNPFATTNDGSCIYCQYGCLDTLACNYNPLATCDDGSCNSVYGCTDTLACNYNPLATCDDGSCAGMFGCMDALYLEYSAAATCDDGSCVTLIVNTSCGAITGVNMTDVIHDRAQFNWDDMNSATCVVDQIRIRYSDDGGATYSNKTMGAPVGNNAPCLNTSKLVLNLTASTQYVYDFKVWYQDGSSVNWHANGTFTTADVCVNATNMTATPTSTSATEFCWDAPASSWEFVRLQYRENVPGSSFSNIGGFGVIAPALCKTKNGLVAGTDYRVMWRTWCNATGGPYRSPVWDGPVIWTQPTVIRLAGGTTINNLAVYPNPSRDIFNVSFTSEDAQDLKVRILNVIGEELINENLEQFIGEYTKQINLSNNAKGIYFLEIETNDGIINKKLILQ